MAVEYKAPLNRECCLCAVFSISVHTVSVKKAEDASPMVALVRAAQ